MLIETFLSIDTKVVKAVLAASAGRSSTAATATAQQILWRAPQNQLEADEVYARRLAEQYDSDSKGQATYNQREPSRRGPNQQRPYYDEDDRDHSFFDDDLPEIGKTSNKASWKRKRGSTAGFTPSGRRLTAKTTKTSSQGTSKQGERGASATKHGTQRYDADTHGFDEDAFERLALRDDDVPPPRPPRTSSRGKANQDLFKPQPKPPQSGPVDEVDAAERRALLTDQDPDKIKKWQSLTSVAQHPDEDNDPFSLGDNENDKPDDIRKEDTERLKAAARSLVSAGASGDAAEGLRESERSGSVGTRNNEAEELLSGKKNEGVHLLERNSAFSVFKYTDTHQDVLHR
ncbi:ubiquitin-binding protein cue5 [Friedmanniomyces endolithicus]|nr:ubiquitin-binding protein cue5 [Friedmanniomyces endolithicus]KAK0302087.1 ubiquitin-binding protein cue5 [Friedmanniomyces endolithicus]KAK0929260.1 ubiquitin-binding protein cue5 [Friedmanniomyces endolithicus]